VLPCAIEPRPAQLLETPGRLVADEEAPPPLPDVSTVEEEKLSALMGEKEEIQRRRRADARRTGKTEPCLLTQYTHRPLKPCPCLTGENRWLGAGWALLVSWRLLC